MFVIVNSICLFQPLPPENFTSLEFVDKTVGTNVPKQFISAIERVRLKLLSPAVHRLSLNIYHISQHIDISLRNIKLR